jgi:oxalate decarboxylase
MNDAASKDLFSRRKFLESSSAAIAAAGMLASDAAAQGEKQPYPSNDERKPYPTKDDRSSSAPGPGNPEIDAQNPDSFLPPQTDAGGVQAFKYPFGIAHKRMQEGGWSREVTVRELPVSKSIAGVDMRLTAGGVRELHWHTAGEWAIMLYGNARITGLDSEGKSFVDDVGEATYGISPPAFRTPSRASSPTVQNSCWSSTTATSPNTKPCCSPTGWPTLPRTCSRKISASMRSR